MNRGRVVNAGNSVLSGLTVLMLVSVLAGGGCSAVPKMAGVAEDHSVRLISRPVSAPTELAWRMKTFGRMSFSRANVRYLRFSRLERNLPVPDLETLPEVAPNRAIRKQVQRYGGPPVPGTVSFLAGGDVFFRRLEAELDSATRRIDVKTYIFDNDAYAIRIADLLRERSAEGAQVRVLLDMIGSRRAWRVLPEGAEPGRTRNTVRHLKRRSNINVRRSDNTWLSSDHVKFFTVDGETAYLGGMNIGWEYRYDWRDMMSELTGPVVQELERYFDTEWHRAGWLGDLELLRRLWRRQPEYAGRKGDADLYILMTTPWRHHYFRTMLAAIESARSRLYIEYAYLWNQQILHALCAARHRGVDVRVVMPMHTNISIARGADRVTANTLLLHGVRVFLYPGMTHKKAALIDDWVFWGSANMDDLSLHKNKEMNLATSDENIVQELHEILLQGQEEAAELTEPLSTRVWDYLSSRMADLL